MTDDEVKRLVFEPPDENTPGYLRRIIARDKFTRAINTGDIGEDFYDNLIDFLLPFIVEPEDRTQAREALLDATEAQYRALLKAVNPEPENPTSPKPSETN